MLKIINEHCYYHSLYTWGVYLVKIKMQSKTLLFKEKSVV